MANGGSTDLVWYVAYGSNQCRARLQEYLDRSRDPSPPVADRALTIRHALFFAGASRVWGGGRAYIDHGPGGRTLARAWLLTRGQWADVHALESARPVDDDLDPASVADGECRRCGTGIYDVLVGLGAHHGVPAVTFTGPEPLDPATCTAPVAAYLARIAEGLAEGHGLTVDEAVAYLTGRPGVAGQWTAPALRAALRGPSAAG